MKIAIFTSSSVNMMVHRKNLIRGLLGKGHELHLIVSQDQQYSELSSHFVASLHSVPLSRTGTNPFSEVRTLFYLRKLIRSIAPDVIINFTPKSVLYGSLAAHWAGIKNIYSVTTGLGRIFSRDTLGYLFLRVVVKLLYKMALPKNRKVFFQNPDDQQLFQQWGLITPQQGEIIAGSGVDLSHFSRTNGKSWPNSFIMVARLLEDKGVREFVQAARKIKHDHPQTIFSLMGNLETGLMAITQKELQKWIDSGVINYIPYSPQVKEQLQKHQVFVLPSYYREGIPLSILEAMSMEMPVITTLAPGCRETVIEGENGHLIPVKDAPALAARMKKFLDHPDYIKKLGQAGRQICEEKFDARKVNDQMIKSIEASKLVVGPLAVDTQTL